MPVIKDEDSLNTWLETRPREDAILIAARAALRALPGLASLFRSKMEDPYTIILPVFRANAAAHLASRRSTLRQGVASASAAAARAASQSALSSASSDSAAAAAESASETAYAATDPPSFISGPDYSTTDYDIDAERQARYKARSAALFATRTARSSARFIARSAARSVALSVNHAEIAVNVAIERDAELLQSGTPRAEVLATPLWRDGSPEGVGEEWPFLRDNLIEHHASWRVWIDWYQDRLDGKPINEALEIEKALIPDTDWEQGPTYVNAIIAELIEKHAQEVPDFPEPTPSPTNYVYAGELLEIIAAESAAAPNDATEIAWSVLRETLNGLKAGGVSNSMRVAPAIDRTLVALGDAPDQVDIIRLGMAGMELQAFAEVADNVLMEDAAAMLKAAVAQHALLVAQFEEWRAFKAQLLPPLGEREAEREAVREAADLHHELASDGLLSEAADARMSEEEAAALPEPAVTGEAVTPEPESERGFLRSMRSAVRAFASAVMKKMHDNAVSLTAAGVPTGAAFVFVKYSDTLTALATKLPTEFGWVLQWIQWLKTVLV